MIFVSFHKSIDNVYAFDDHGHLLSSDVLAPGGPARGELRGLYLGQESGLLYVVNAGSSESDASNILCFTRRSATSYSYLSTVVAPTAQANPILHPFAAAFDGAGNCYVSNQDTNVVAAFAVGAGRWAPEPVASYLQGLYPTGAFLEGTLVASGVGQLPHVSPTTPVPEPEGGLGVTFDDAGKVDHSVRDVAVCGGLLLVADEAAGVVRVYDPATGGYLGASNPVAKPTHLLVSGPAVYLTASDQILSCPAPCPGGPLPDFTPIGNPKDGTLSGMAVDDGGNCFVGDRTKKELRKYGPAFRGHKWSKPLKDEPEFLLYVPG